MIASSSPQDQGLLGRREEEELAGGSERLPVARDRRPQHRAAPRRALQETYADFPQGRRRGEGALPYVLLVGAVAVAVYADLVCVTVYLRRARLSCCRNLISCFWIWERACLRTCITAARCTKLK